VQITYSRIKKSQFKHLKVADGEVVDKVDKVADEKEKSTPKDPEETAQDKVKAAHRLLRNFNYAVNV